MDALEAQLTASQRQVLTHLRQREQRGLPPPCLDELCTELGLASRGSLHKHIRALVACGLVFDLAGKQRGVRLRDVAPHRSAGPQSREIPLLGKIAAGKPIDALAGADVLSVPAALLPNGECFALLVQGDSMQDAGILDGDQVLIRSQSSARNGEIVVALIEREEATLKRIEQRPNEVLLHAENPRYVPQRYRPEQISIQGVLVGLMRRY
jgi:repressor LexA